MSCFHVDLHVHVLYAQHIDLLPTFGGGVEQRLLQETGVVGDNLLFDAAGTLPVARQADVRRRVEDEQAAVVAEVTRLRAQAEARIGTQRGAISHREASQVQALLYDVVEEVKGVAVDLLVVLVIADHSATVIGRDDACWYEALRRECAFS